MIELEPACRGMAVLVAGVREEQWGAATPCAGWNVGELVAHVREVARGFAEMAREASGGSGAEASGGPTSRWPG
ncbi:maleylpyruvate isomerase N-terminal domain-containing protein, partial [Streptomyces cacaoi]|uniref:maleylpyruvate isomerase N-terminal domain-containing protein n=2 Tax=Streptomyces TaxID=1883 RepID=UPI00374991E8